MLLKQYKHLQIDDIVFYQSKYRFVRTVTHENGTVYFTAGNCKRIVKKCADDFIKNPCSFDIIKRKKTGNQF